MSPAIPMPAESRRALMLREIANALRDVGADITDIDTVVANTEFTAAEVVEQFGSMDSVVVALVVAMVGAMSEPLGECHTEASFREQLRDFGRLVMSEERASQLRILYRIAITDSIRHTGIAREFYQKGPGLLTDKLAALIQSGQAAGFVRKEDSHLLASHFMALLRADLDLSEVFEAEHQEGDPSSHRDVSEVVDVFCEGIKAEAAK